MSEEITNTGEIKIEEIMVEEAKGEEAKIDKIKESTPENGLSKVKIRHILAMRIKKYGARRVISYILVAVIFFCSGAMADRLVMGHRGNRGFSGNPGIQSGIPGNSFGNGKHGGFNKGQQPPANNPPSQNKTQGTQPADWQKK